MTTIFGTTSPWRPRIIRLLALVAVLVAVTYGLWRIDAGSLAPLVDLTVIAILVTATARGRIQNIALSAVTLSLCLCAIETVALVLEPKIVVDQQHGVDVPRLLIGWGPGQPGAYHAKRTFNGRTVYDVTYTIDDRLLRKTETGPMDPSRPNGGRGIAFFGDSFIFGVGLADNETLPQQVADREGRHYPIYNLGFGGYSPAHMLAELQGHWADDVLAKTQLVVNFVAPWHADRVACDVPFVKGAPSYAIRDGKLTFAGTCGLPAPSMFESFAFYRVFVKPRRRIIKNADLDLLVAIVEEEIRISIETYKQPVVILYLSDAPYLRGLSWTDDKIMDAFRASGATVIDTLLPDKHNPKYELAGDGHPTGLANAIKAKMFDDLLKERFAATGLAGSSK